MSNAFLFIVALILGCLLSATAIVVVSVRLVAGFWPKFSSSLLTAIAVSVTGFIVASESQSQLGSTGPYPTLTFLVTALINIACLHFLIRKPDGQRLGFAHACFATVIQFAAELILFASVVVFLWYELIKTMSQGH